MPGIISTFKSGEPSLAEMLSDINYGKIQLPDFQRGWIWYDDHIRSLIDSVSMSYPIGAVMLLQTGGDGAKFQPRLIEGVDPRYASNFWGSDHWLDYKSYELLM